MSGETNLTKLLKTLKPEHIPGDYVFCTVPSLTSFDLNEIQCSCKEKEGISLVVRKDYADQMKLTYSSVMAWITLTVHSSLDAVGMTAAFSNALAEKNITCNVVAAAYHDHIFVGQKDLQKAMDAIGKISEQ